jgi:hypothetical protein
MPIPTIQIVYGAATSHQTETQIDHWKGPFPHFCPSDRWSTVAMGRTVRLGPSLIVSRHQTI